ncbi:MAG: hypothetical protein MUE79_01520 [Nitratireductor sp.]|jgi:hypothetical protein|nr:hypothetical protein [Nitratireductor sp.]
MKCYRLQFKGQDKGPEEEFRDLALAKSEAMKRATDKGLGEDISDPDEWVCRIYEGEDLIHEVVAEDLPDREPDGDHVTPVRPASDVEGDQLHEALDESFPASDPPSTSSPTVATKVK